MGHEPGECSIALWGPVCCPAPQLPGGRNRLSQYCQGGPDALHLPAGYRHVPFFSWFFELHISVEDVFAFFA